MSSGTVVVRDEGTILELQGCGANVYSQYGEDGLIRKSLDILGETNRWCFEIGAADGVFCSNTHVLRDAGWKAVLIEKDARQYEKLAKFANGCVVTIHKEVEARELSGVLSSVGGFPESPDLGVIDVDGADYWFLSELKHTPRILMVEHAAGTDNPVPTGNDSPQAGVTAIRALGERLGYRPVAETLCNTLFWREDLV